MPVRPSALALCFIPLLAACSEAERRWPVRATLDDDQVLLGAVDTPVLLLEGGLGTIAIPWDDVGEVSPVEGEALATSGGFVDVWLRNGSELTGRWADPNLAMALVVGGRDVAVNVPVDQLLRLQTQGGEAWPQGVVYRARTTHGDDFLVDPETTRLVLENGMGRFEPFLTECLSVAPLGEPTGPWRIALLTGTVLVGPLAEGSVQLRLPMGPAQAAVPLEALVSLTREDWGSVVGGGAVGLVDRIMPARASSAEPAVLMPEAPAEALQALGYMDDLRPTGGGARPDAAVVETTVPTPAAVSPAGWFDASGLREAKQAMH